MRTLITGATGLLGSNLLQLLIKRGESLRLLVRGSADRRVIRYLPHEEVRGDVTDFSSVKDAMDGVFAVYHLAGVVRFDKASGGLLQQVHVDGTRNVLEAAAAAGVRRVVHVSTVAAVGHGLLENPATEETPFNFDSSSPYHATKREGEAVALSYDSRRLEVVVANPTYLFGAYDVKPSSGRLLLAVARGLIRFYPAGGNNFASARSVAEGLIACMQKGRPGQRYILGGENLTYRQMLTIAAEEAGVSPPILPAPSRLLSFAGRLGDLGGHVAPELFEQINTPLVESMQLPAYVSSRKAVTELGYVPTLIRPGIRAALAWFQEEGYLPRTHALGPTGALT